MLKHFGEVACKVAKWIPLAWDRVYKS